MGYQRIESLFSVLQFIIPHQLRQYHRSRTGLTVKLGQYLGHRTINDMGDTRGTMIDQSQALKRPHQYLIRRIPEIMPFSDGHLN